MEATTTHRNTSSGQPFGQDKPVIVLPAGTGRYDMDVVVNAGPFEGETFRIANLRPLKTFTSEGLEFDAWQMTHTAEQAPKFHAKYLEVTDARIAAANAEWAAKPACGCCGQKGGEMVTSSRHGLVCVPCFTRSSGEEI